MTDNCLINLHPPKKNKVEMDPCRVRRGLLWIFGVSNPLKSAAPLVEILAAVDAEDVAIAIKRETPDRTSLSIFSPAAERNCWILEGADSPWR